MNVTICCKQFGRGGGAERFLLNFVRCLRDAGHGVRVFAAAVDSTVEGVEIAPLPMSWSPGVLRDLAIARASARLLADADANVTFSDQRCWGAQVVRVGGGLHREYLKQQTRSYLAPVGRAAYRIRRTLSLRDRLKLHIDDRLYRHPSLRCIIANSHMVEREIAGRYPGMADRIRVVHNGVDTEHFTLSLRDRHRDGVRAELGIPENALTGVFVGTGWRRKGLHTFVRALGIASRRGGTVYGIVVGRGSRRRMLQYAARHGAGQSIRFVGGTDPEPYYGAADLLVLPSYYDPCANVTLEGLACGLPVITAATNGCHEVLTPGREGYVLDDASDADGLAGHIEEFRDPARLTEASKVARALALEHTLERQYREIMQALEDVAREGG